MVVKVVVLGCGLAGSACVSLLDSLAKSTPITITVVDVRTESISKYAGCRAATLGESYAYRVTIPNGNIVSEKNGVVLNKWVKAIDEQDKLIIFEDDSEEPWDILVCATGARNVSPCEPPLNCRGFEEQVDFYEHISSLIKKAKHVTVLGSGAVGTELAGEIKNHYKLQKEVAVLSPGSVLVDGCRYPPPKKFYRKVEKLALKMGIHLYLKQKPINLSLDDFQGNSYLTGKREILTDEGKKFETELVLLCTGKRLNNEIYPKRWLDAEGSIPVKPTLQTTFRDDVFAIGDINNVDETKQGYFAQKQARVAARNIENIVKKKASSLKEYKPQIATNILIPLGRDVGISYLGGIIMGSMITSRIKGKDLFIKEHWGLYKVRKQLIKEGVDEWRNLAKKNYGKRSKSTQSSNFLLPNLVRSLRSGPNNKSRSASDVSGHFTIERAIQLAKEGKLEDDQSSLNMSAEDYRLLDPSALSAFSQNSGYSRTGDVSAASGRSGATLGHPNADSSGRSRRRLNNSSNP